MLFPGVQHCSDLLYQSPADIRESIDSKACYNLPSRGQVKSHFVLVYTNTIPDYDLLKRPPHLNRPTLSRKVDPRQSIGERLRCGRKRYVVRIPSECAAVLPCQMQQLAIQFTTYHVRHYGRCGSAPRKGAIVTAYLRQYRGRLLANIVRNRHEHATHPAKINGREEIREIHVQNALTLRVLASICGYAFTYSKSMD